MKYGILAVSKEAGADPELFLEGSLQKHIIMDESHVQCNFCNAEHTFPYDATVYKTSTHQAGSSTVLTNTHFITTVKKKKKKGKLQEIFCN